MQQNKKEKNIAPHTVKSLWYNFLVIGCNYLRTLSSKKDGGAQMKLKNDLFYIRDSVYGMSQSELAKKSGVRREAIREIEEGTRTPSLATALLLAKALGCNVEDIFKLEE